MSKKNREKAFTSNGKPPLKPLNAAQKEYLNSLRHCPMVVVFGPSGTGKTYMAAVEAADLLEAGDIQKIVLSRPNVSGGPTLGSFPGLMEEKFGQWLTPITATLSERLGKGAFDCALKNGKIEFVPLETMRGRSFDNSFIIFDESQNLTYHQVKLFTSRIGKNTRVVMNGDVMQSDLKSSNGLSILVDVIERYDIDVDIIEFDMEDIVRGDLCAQFVKGFYQYENNK